MKTSNCAHITYRRYKGDMFDDVSNLGGGGGVDEACCDPRCREGIFLLRGAERVTICEETFKVAVAIVEDLMIERRMG